MLSSGHPTILRGLLTKKEAKLAFTTLFHVIKLIDYFLLQLPPDNFEKLKPGFTIAVDIVPDITSTEATLFNCIATQIHNSQSDHMHTVLSTAVQETLSILNVNKMTDLNIDLSAAHIQQIISNLCDFYKNRYETVMAYWAAKQLSKTFAELNNQDHEALITPYRDLFKAITVHARKVEETQLLILNQRPQNEFYYCQNGEDKRELQQGMLLVFCDQGQWISRFLSERDPCSSRNLENPTKQESIALVEKNTDMPEQTSDQVCKIKLKGFFNFARRKILHQEMAYFSSNKPYSKLLVQYPSMERIIQTIHDIISGTLVLHDAQNAPLPAYAAEP